MEGSCWWNSACLCVFWSYNKQWSNGIIRSYISFIHTSPRPTDLRQLQGRRDKKRHEPSMCEHRRQKCPNSVGGRVWSVWSVCTPISHPLAAFFRLLRSLCAQIFRHHVSDVRWSSLSNRGMARKYLQPATILRPGVWECILNHTKHQLWIHSVLAHGSHDALRASALARWRASQFQMFVDLLEL